MTRVSRPVGDMPLIIEDLLIQAQDLHHLGARRVRWARAWLRRRRCGVGGSRCCRWTGMRAENAITDGRPCARWAWLAGEGVPAGGSRLAMVFGISQTPGRGRPAQPEPVLLAGEAPLGLWDSLQQLVENEGFRASHVECDRDHARRWNVQWSNEHCRSADDRRRPPPLKSGDGTLARRSPAGLLLLSISALSPLSRPCSR